MTELTLVQAVNRALAAALRTDPDVVLLGEDIGVNGGVFRATEGLFKEFGGDRVIDTPLSRPGSSERPSAWPSTGSSRSPRSSSRISSTPPSTRSSASSPSSAIARGASTRATSSCALRTGGGVKGGLYHSQSAEAYFTHTAGLKVVIPSTPADAKGLLLSAIADEDPVLFFEPKRIYRSISGEVPDGDHRVPLGEAKVAREGADVSVFAYGAMMPLTLQAAEKLSGEGIDAEVIDLRTLVPLDEKKLISSVEKTGRAVIVHEAPRFCGLPGRAGRHPGREGALLAEGPRPPVTAGTPPFPMPSSSCPCRGGSDSACGAHLRPCGLRRWPAELRFRLPDIGEGVAEGEIVGDSSTRGRSSWRMRRSSRS